jgi:hypothetical protein
LIFVSLQSQSETLNITEVNTMKSLPSKSPIQKPTYLRDNQNRRPVINPEFDASFVKNGVTSVSLDAKTLKAAAGLEIAGTKNTVAPANGLDVGFKIDADSSFSYRSQNGFAPVGGTIEHSGTVSLKADALGVVTVGDFSIGYDAARKSDKASGFFVRDTVDTDAILFDVSNPKNLSANNSSLKISGADLLVSPEFNGFLNQKHLTNQNLTGADVGDVSIDAISKSFGSGCSIF